MNENSSHGSEPVTRAAMDTTEIEIDKIDVRERFRKELGDIDELAKSIMEIGLLHPIVLDSNDKLIAGARRIEAFKKLHRQTIPYTRVDLKEIVQGELQENVVRKDFLPSEAVAIMRYISSMKVHHRPEKGAKLAPFPKGKSSVIAGNIVGMSHGTLKTAAKVVDAAEKDPELKPILDKMDDGSLTVIEAYNKVKKHERKQEHIASPTVKLPDSINIFNSDFRDAEREIVDNTIDLIFTDPPYSAEYLPLYKDLGIMASRVLREGGCLVTYLGQHTIPQVLQYMSDAGLNYWWILAVKHTGASASVYGRQVFVGWKPLLWFVKGKKLMTGEFMSDYIESKPPEKALHEWEQSTVEAEHVIHQLTYENGVVFDPFMGSGTTGAAALKLKRQFIGVELDKEKFNLARIRLGKIQE